MSENKPVWRCNVGGTGGCLINTYGEDKGKPDKDNSCCIASCCIDKAFTDKAFRDKHNLELKEREDKRIVYDGPELYNADGTPIRTQMSISSEQSKKA